jgi:hypothetical protein
VLHAHAFTSEERALYTLLRARLPPPREWREKSWYETAKGKLFSGLDRVGEGVFKAVSSSFKYVLFYRFFPKLIFLRIDQAEGLTNHQNDEVRNVTYPPFHPSRNYGSLRVGFLLIVP